MILLQVLIIYLGDAKLKTSIDDALVSHVVSINGADVDQYLTKITEGAGLQDWDSLSVNSI